MLMLLLPRTLRPPAQVSARDAAAVSRSLSSVRMAPLSVPDGLTGEYYHLSSHDLHVIHLVIVVCCALSMLGCAFIVWHHWRSRHQRLVSTVSQRMVLVLSVSDFVNALAKISGLPSDYAEHAFECRLQGFTISLSGLMTVFWSMCLANSIYRQVVYRDSEAALRVRFKLYILVSVLCSGTIASALLAANKYGNSVFYCWIVEKNWYLFGLYVWIILAIAYITVTLLITHVHIAKRANVQGSLEALESSAAIVWKLRIYIIVFVILWLPSIIFRCFSSLIGNASFPLAIVMQITRCSQGLANGVIYGGLLRKVVAFWSAERRAATYVQAVSPSVFPATTSPRKLSQDTHTPANIFVSTFNMGEGRLEPSDLMSWIPTGHDIYVIGLQECLHLSEVRKQLRQHIEQRISPNDLPGIAYHQFHREIGSKNTSLGYHGHIAITVFIRSADVASGAFYMPQAAQQEVNCGTSLVVSRASNKGAVGFAFRYYDSSFAFVTCHLSSDSKGRSKVLRRNRDAVDMLQTLHLNADDFGFEFPYLHHHSFVLGDLNYRLTQRNADAHEILDLVANVHRIEVEEAAAVRIRSSLKRWSWNSSLLRSYGPSRSFDVEMGGQDRVRQEREVKSEGGGDGGVDASRTMNEDFLGEDDQPSWNDVLIHDELKSWMESSQVFYGFHEEKIEFPPSYRRVRGVGLGHDSNWSTGEELSVFYTTSVPGGGARVPSYTDRILYFSHEDMLSRLRCVRYSSCEAVKCSDHKPVTAVFQALVDKDHKPIDAMSSGRTIYRMQDMTGVLECSLRITFTSILWTDPPIRTERRHSTHQRETNQEPILDAASVSIVFPLPSEDIFSEHRKLHELADTMYMGMFGGDHGGSASDQILSRGNVAMRSWPQFCQEGITHTTFVRPTMNMHAAIKVHLDAAHCFGQGVISLPQACFEGYQESFKIWLAVGGRRTGSLSGNVTVDVARRSSLL